MTKKVVKITCSSCFYIKQSGISTTIRFLTLLTAENLQCDHVIPGKLAYVQAHNELL